jgi:CBS domain-containing protein
MSIRCPPVGGLGETNSVLVFKNGFSEEGVMANAGEIMTTNVVVARPDMLVRDVAKLLLDHGISAAPVVDDAGKLLGIVSEGDLISERAAHSEKRRAWWLEMLADGFALAPRFEEYVRLQGPKAADVMTRKVITVTPETPAETVAQLIERHRIKRVLVTRDGKLAGIVSRADLVRMLAHSAPPKAEAIAEEERKREELRGRFPRPGSAG